jgi:putative colanic acid biosynthesis acetyltransferase WcaB
MFKFIFQDFKFNNNIKSKFILLSFRLCQVLIKNKFLAFIFFPILLFHRIIIEWFMGTELNWNLKVNGKLKLFHGQGLIINPNTIFGDGCTVRCNTVIGNNGKDKNAPVLGKNVDIGVNCCIIGNIKIGDNVIIGAGTVITKDIPSNVVVVGNPAKIIKTNIIMSDYV